MKIFVIAEREQPVVELCAGARQFADEVDLVVLPTTNVVPAVADTLYRLEVPEGRMIEDTYVALANLIETEKPDAIFAESSRRIQLLIGRAAARVGASVISNVTEMQSAKEASTMYFGGLANRKYKGSDDSISFYFIRPATFPDAEPSGDNVEADVAFIEPPYEVKRIDVGPRVKGDVDLSSAKRIVSVGRGIKEEKDLEMVRELCDLIDAELGCSRSIYEAENWLPKEALVGISGSTVVPDLYLTLGISGQAQHMVACDGATTIMCVNTDPYALIFEHSDYGSKADLYMLVPRMIDYFKAHPLK
jgi:electron transfer flavoprotein alpha subunit